MAEQSATEPPRLPLISNISGRRGHDEFAAPTTGAGISASRSASRRARPRWSDRDTASFLKSDHADVEPGTWAMAESAARTMCFGCPACAGPLRLAGAAQAASCVHGERSSGKTCLQAKGRGRPRCRPPFQRQRCWFDAPASPAIAGANAGVAGARPGRPLLAKGRAVRYPAAGPAASTGNEAHRRKTSADYPRT